jgi:hypothetical protein
MQDVKEELKKDKEVSKKNRIKQKPWEHNFLKSNKKIQLKATPADWSKWKIEFQGLKTK